MDSPDFITAIDALAGVTDGGYTFLGSDGKEQFFTFDALRKEAMNRAAHLRAQGLKKGDRLALVMPDGVDFVPTFLGASAPMFRPTRLRFCSSLRAAPRLPRAWK